MCQKEVDGNLDKSLASPSLEQMKGNIVKDQHASQRRKANEGVRISHLNPDTRMNSKDEFRQGTNISMRATRGVGV